MSHWKKIRGPKMPGDKSGIITFQNQCVGVQAVLKEIYSNKSLSYLRKISSK